ncbi:MAG TPA: aldo/keto reductase [Mycobacteriales bacterium]|jgi:aryl-alcohol dehydrogenase-like predicted oxidoreductase|nr:aldo/keto reductase [Mycobacteriales bacterium]
MTIPTRKLGSSGLEVSMQGLGCMGMSQSYGKADPVESRATIDRAIELGVTFLDTANVYGDGHNETFLGEALRGRRDQIILATKFTLSRDDGSMQIDGRPENVRRCIDESLSRLDTDHVDLYYQHRVDPNVAIEDTVGAMAELVQAGKVRYLGLSEASSKTLERASAVHPIAALQSEWSLWTRDLEVDVVATARRLGIGLVPFSPLGRGFLTGAITSPDDFDDDDFRKGNPRFQGENFAKNLELVDAVREIAGEKGCTPGQLALAWVMAQGEDVVPIPGTKRPSYLEENVAACDVSLSDDDLRRLDQLAPQGVAAGGRYPGATAPVTQYGDSPQS